MSIIRFIGTENHVNANLSFEESNHIKIQFKNKVEVPHVSILLSGFRELNEHNYIEQSDFSEMKYLYRKIDELTYILTNNSNDIYIESQIPEISDENYIDFLPEPYIPTVDELKLLKISKLSKICNTNITSGVDINIDGTIEHFSYTEEDQMNLKEIFDLVIQANVPMYYHSDGNSCKLYTMEQIIELYTTATINKMHHITYFNQLKMYISTLDKAEDIDAIEYGIDLTGEYLDTYNSAMEQVKVGMNTLLRTE